MNRERKKTLRISLIGGIIVIAILILGTFWMGQSSRRDTDAAVHSVSLLYLDELAGRREQVVANNLEDNIDVINVAIGLMTDEDLSDIAHLQAYQARMKALFHLEKFAFVDESGLIYTSLGMRTNIDQYLFDYKTLSGPEISVLNEETAEKKVVIAAPVEDKFLEGKKLAVCFMEIDMQVMLQGVSLTSQNTGATFCNIYTHNGTALSNTVLGGLAVEDNLLEAMQHAEPDKGYSCEKMAEDFRNGVQGVITFTYDGIHETLSYIPIKGTDWFLTYLVRESVISDQIRTVSDNIIRRSLLQSIMTALVLIGMFSIIVVQARKTAAASFEQEMKEAENRVKQQEMENRLALQEQIIEQQQQSERQARLITALSSDYWSVFYISLDADHGICYQSLTEYDGVPKIGEEFSYLETFTAYANRYVAETNREEFLAFISPDAVREGLLKESIISYRYTVCRDGRESYEMVRFAGVRHREDINDQTIHAIGACFSNVDAETRKTLEQNQVLSEALTAAENASKAKTVFLSSMSHEIRTPMNAIIGLVNIALNDPELSDRTKDYLTKIDTSADHLLKLINDILDMSRIESGRMVLKNEDFAFQKLLEAINTMFSGQCQDKGLEYRCNIVGPVDDYYNGDNLKLRQVLINILGNAVKFTPEGGSVSLTIERTAQFENHSTLCFRIADTGIGMSPEYLPHIFDAFSQEDSSSTTRYGSSGLGMALTKTIVEMMNGNIGVESEKGKGTTITVTVTLRNSDRKNDSGDSGEIPAGEMAVLIVDDDPIACEHAQLVLDKAGISSETASSGAEALRMVQLRQARMEPYHLILMDWKMPEMDGVETTRRIRAAAGSDSTIIIMTAYRWDDVLEDAVEAGVDSFISKPLFAAAVLEEFRSAYKKKQALAGKAESKADLTGRRILVAEDIPINAEIIVMLLQMREIETDLAENGRIAVEQFTSHPAGYYDAILMDMRMPEMDGLEATKAIRALDREDAKTIPIIALTANAFDEDVQQSMQAGLNAHLSKPVDPDGLFETLENLIK